MSTNARYIDIEKVSGGWRATDKYTDYRWYYRYGDPHPCISLTSVLSWIGKSDLLEWVGRVCAQKKHPEAYKWVRDKAGKLGTEYHKLAEDRALGRPISTGHEGKKESNNSVINVFQKQVAWEETQDIEDILVEQWLVDPELGIGCTGDRLAIVNGVVEVWEYKTGGWLPSGARRDTKATWQAAVCAIQAEKLLRVPKVQALRILQCEIKTGKFNPKGIYVPRRKSIEGCYKSFLHLFQAWKAFHYSYLLKGIPDPFKEDRVYKWPQPKIFED